MTALDDATVFRYIDPHTLTNIPVTMVSLMENTVVRERKTKKMLG